MSKAIILCVDDEAIILLSLKEELRRILGNRFKYELAVNAQEALSLTESFAGQGRSLVLVITDWLMPGMKGDEMIRRIKKIYPSTAVILITGQADLTAVEKVRDEIGSCRILEKPWTAADLVESLQSCLEE